MPTEELAPACGGASKLWGSHASFDLIQSFQSSSLHPLTFRPVSADRGASACVWRRRWGRPPSSLPAHPEVAGMSLNRMLSEVRPVRAASSLMSESVCLQSKSKCAAASVPHRQMQSEVRPVRVASLLMFMSACLHFCASVQLHQCYRQMLSEVRHVKEQPAC